MKVSSEDWNHFDALSIKIDPEPNLSEPWDQKELSWTLH